MIAYHWIDLTNEQLPCGAVLASAEGIRVTNTIVLTQSC